MGTIAVFDSGLGSLSIIEPIRRLVRCDMVYFADQRNFPYGDKSHTKLRTIITDRIKMLDERFAPDVIIIGSNTPSILFGDILGDRILGVRPPLTRAARTSRTGRVAILGTKSVVNGAELGEFIRGCGLSDSVRVFGVDASALVELVESGAFIDEPVRCARVVHQLLNDTFTANKIDAATLSSTHLPFLMGYLRAAFPHVRFLDPACDVASKVARMVSSGRTNRMRVYTSSDPSVLRRRLSQLNMHQKVSYLP